MKKLLFACLFLTCMIVPVHGEEGIAIYTPQDLMSIASDPAGTYYLASDLDMSCVLWQGFDFSGRLDGCGHSLLNLTIFAPGSTRSSSLDGNQREYSTAFAGLFSVMENAEVRNLNLLNVRSVLSCDEPVFLGAVAGKSLNSTIENCTVTGCLELRAHDRIFGLGGIVGYGSGTVSRSTVDMTLICVDTDAATKDEQFLGGVYATGFMTVCDCEITLDGYVSEHGYVHNGGITGMMMQYPLGSNSYANIERNTVSANFLFFEDNPDRRAYCEPLIGEILGWSYTMRDNETHFLRDERRVYDRELRPEPCDTPMYSRQVVPPGETTFGYTEYTCTVCGYAYRDEYTLPGM